MWTLTLVIALLALIYYYGTKSFSYWKQKGVKHEKPLPFYGNMFDQFIQRISFSDLITKLYWKFPGENLVGFYIASRPDLIIKDPEIIKHILVADFNNFYPRGLNINPDYVEPMLKNLFFADGDLWKLLRQRMTPAFTTGKLKAMFPLIVERAEKLQKIADTAAKTGEEVNIRDLLARYTTDFIGACAFGIDADTLNDEEAEFRKLGKRIFTITKRDAFVAMVKLVLPNLFKKMHVLHPDLVRDLNELVNSIIKQRNNKPSGRNDFIDLMLEMKDKVIVSESIEKTTEDGTPAQASLEFDVSLLAAQAFVFFGAGFETSSSATSFLLHELAYHPEIQSKCQREIDVVLSKYDGHLCYDAIKELKYLEMCFKEGMRLFPPLGFLMRKCVREYQIPNTDVVIDKGVAVFIPLHAMNHDEKYFDSPEEFRPERFHPDNVSNIKKHVYLPFGEGPRACIGERLGLMQSLAGVAAILQKFSVAPSKSSKRHLTPDPTTTIIQGIKGGIPLALFERKNAV